MTTVRWTDTKMTVLIDGSGTHDPSDHHYMVVNGHGFLLDLSRIQGQLLDPTVTRVTWGPRRDGNDLRHGGVVTKQDGTTRIFWESELLKPYLDAWRKRKAELLPGA